MWPPPLTWAAEALLGGKEGLEADGAPATSTAHPAPVLALALETWVWPPVLLPSVRHGWPGVPCSGVPIWTPSLQHFRPKRGLLRATIPSSVRLPGKWCGLVFWPISLRVVLLGNGRGHRGSHLLSAPCGDPLASTVIISFCPPPTPFTGVDTEAQTRWWLAQDPLSAKSKVRISTSDDWIPDQHFPPSPNSLLAAATWKGLGVWVGG